MHACVGEGEHGCMGAGRQVHELASYLQSLELTVREDANEGFNLGGQHGSCICHSKKTTALWGCHPGILEGNIDRRL